MLLLGALGTFTVYPNRRTKNIKHLEIHKWYSFVTVFFLADMLANHNL